MIKKILVIWVTSRLNLNLNRFIEIKNDLNWFKFARDLKFTEIEKDLKRFEFSILCPTPRATVFVLAQAFDAHNFAAKHQFDTTTRYSLD